MKRDKSWFKQQLVKHYPSQGEIDNPDYEVIAKVEIIDEAFNLINQMDEPEGIKIPQIVANYLEGKEDWNAFELFYDIDEMNKDSDPISKWMYDNSEKENKVREIMFLKALREGFTVSKEPKFRVEFPKLIDNELTEEEIKAMDKRFWEFAVLVEDN